MTIRHDCTNGCYVQLHLPDWAFLTPAFPRGIQPTDLDGFVELNGHFLTLEWKGEGAELTDGQRFAFRRRTLNQTDAVLVLYGDSQRTQCTAMRVIVNGFIGQRAPANNQRVFERCARWAAWAQSRVPNGPRQTIKEGAK